MFEKARIGGCIYNMADALSRDGASVDRRVIEMFKPFIHIAANDMRKQRLSADQAAVAMIINTANTFHKAGTLEDIR